MTDTFGNYGYAGLFLLGGMLFVAFNFTLASIVTRLTRANAPNASKGLTYECGETPTSEAWVQYNVRYYIFAMIFVLFDVEIAFVLPWAVGFEDLLGSVGLLAVVEMGIFLFFLGLGLVYAWRKGALEWVS